MSFLYRFVFATLSLAVSFFATVLICVICFLAIVGAISVGKAYGMDHGFDPNDPRTAWMEKQKQPDTGTNCCGKGDGYMVDRYTPNPDGSYTVDIDDSHEVVFPDGTTRTRLAEEDKHIIVPAEKVNPIEDDLDNPFDHSVIWLAVNPDGTVRRVWCFIRHPQSY